MSSFLSVHMAEKCASSQKKSIFSLAGPQPFGAKIWTKPFVGTAMLPYRWKYFPQKLPFETSLGRPRTFSSEDDILQLHRPSCRALKPGKNGWNRLKILPSDDSIVVGVAVPTLVEENDHGGHLAFANSNQFRRICSRSLAQKQVKNRGKSFY